VSAPCSFALFPFLDRSLSLRAPAHQRPLRGRFFPCHDISLPLRSPEVSNLQSVALFLCPDRSLLRSSVPLARSHSFRLNRRSRSLALSQRCIDPAHAPAASPYALGPNASDAAAVALSAPPADPTPAVPSAMASAAPAQDRQRSPSSVRVNARGSDLGRFCADLHNRGRLALSFAPRRGPRVSSAVAPTPMLSAAYALVPSPSHIAIALPRLGNATSRVAAAFISIAIIVVATVATNTKAPRSDGHSPRCTATTCLRECPRFRSCSNRPASSSRRASSTPHARTASAPSSGSTHVRASELASAAQPSSRGIYGAVMRPCGIYGLHYKLTISTIAPLPPQHCATVAPLVQYICYLQSEHLTNNKHLGPSAFACCSPTFPLSCHLLPCKLHCASSSLECALGFYFFNLPYSNSCRDYKVAIP